MRRPGPELAGFLEKFFEAKNSGLGQFLKMIRLETFVAKYNHIITSNYSNNFAAFKLENHLESI